MKYDVKIACFGHTFNIEGVEATNSEDAEVKAMKAVKRSLYVSSVQPCPKKSEDEVVKTLMDFLGMKR